MKRPNQWTANEKAILKRVVALRPEVQDLIAETSAVKDTGGKSFCANRVWYREYKPELLPLVGCTANIDGLPELDAKFLMSPEAYDVAYEAAYQPLPDCRNCICFL